jgi:hypothetical protein
MLVTFVGVDTHGCRNEALHRTASRNGSASFGAVGLNLSVDILDSGQCVLVVSAKYGNRRRSATTMVVQSPESLTIPHALSLWSMSTVSRTDRLAEYVPATALGLTGISHVTDQDQGATSASVVAFRPPPVREVIGSPYRDVCEFGVQREFPSRGQR